MKYLYCLAMLFIAFNTFAQTNYQTGYIITKSNDTIKGVVDYRNTYQTAKNIQFKRSAENAAVVTYSPGDLKGFFVVPSAFYISFKGMVSHNKNHYPDIDLDRDTTNVPAELFLQKVAGGPNADLYANTDDLKTRFFLKEKNSQLVELVYYEYGNPSEKPRVIPVFTSQLTAIFNKYNKQNDRSLHALESTSFTQSSLENAFNIINNKVTDVVTESDLRFIIGTSVSSVNSTATGILKFDNSATSSNIAPKISLGFDVTGNPNAAKALFRFEVAFSYYKPVYKFSYSPNGINTVDNNTYSFNMITISFVPQLLYNLYNTSSLKFFMGLGASINYCIYQNNLINYYQISSFAPYTLKPVTDTTPQYSPMQVTFPFQAGIVLNNRVDLAAYYSPNVAAGTKLKAQSIGLGLHYLFN